MKRKIMELKKHGCYINHWRKMILNIALIYFSVFFLVNSFGIYSLRAEQMDKIKYLAEFKTRESACVARINNFPVIDNFESSSGTIVAGFNATAFLENGKNSIELLMGAMDPSDEKSLNFNSSCEIVITQDTNNSSVQVTTIRLTVDKDRKIIASHSSNYQGGTFETAIDEQQIPSDEELQMHRSSRNIVVKNIPEWKWVSATPVTERNISEIRNAYIMIWHAMNRRDVDALKRLTSISNKEMGIAEGISPDAIFESSDLPQSVLDKTLSPIPLVWDGYALKSYCGGRVFRLTKGINQNSPLRLKDSNGEIVLSYNPYFSIIDGNVVIVR